VRHGIARSAAAGTVDVEARRIGDRLRVRMRNPGALDAGYVEGIGLANTRQRLAALHGESATLSLMSVDGSVVAELDLPFIAVE
jgi:LytS/YehU family sensor histidine kinase